MKNKIYEKYMRQCFKLALKAEGKTSPNPMVGCVVLDKNGKVISKGYHHKCGENHAERDALLKLTKDEAKGGTLVVNLEPCSHYGKTPPCADLIIEYELKRVVIAMVDPNPLVAGRGIKKLEDAGIEVIQGVLKEDAQNLNEVFIKNITEQKCFVAIKTATTLDGKIATSTGDSKWITSANSREEVQKIRNRYDAILTTSQTVVADNPSMTCRIKNGKNPIRIVVDRTLRTDFSSKIYKNDGEKVVIVTSSSVSNRQLENIPVHITVIKCSEHNKKIGLSEMFEKVYELDIKSVLIEAGGDFCGDLLEHNLVDKIYHFIAPKIVGDNTAKSAFSGRCIKKISNALNFKFESITDYSPDILIVYSKLV